MSDVTVLLHRIAENDREALDALFELLYADIHRMARARLAENGPLTMLDTTSLAHEAYLRLHGAGRIDLDCRGRFMAYVSQVLRNVIVDFARKRNAERRGGGHANLTLNTEIAGSIGNQDEDIIRINDALDELDKVDPRLRKVVEMRYFAGLSEKEIAEALGPQRTHRAARLGARPAAAVGFAETLTAVCPVFRTEMRLCGEGELRPRA